MNKLSSARVQRALAEGKKMPPEDLLTLAQDCMAMAARFAPMRENPKTKVVEENKQFNEKSYMDWMREARENLKAAAPYYAPRLHAVAFAPARTEDGEADIDPRELLITEYMEMRRRGELAVEISKQRRKVPVVIEHAPKPPEDDDADGVAV